MENQADIKRKSARGQTSPVPIANHRSKLESSEDGTQEKLSSSNDSRSSSSSFVSRSSTLPSSTPPSRNALIWFHDIDRVTAENLLKENGTHRACIVRPTSSRADAIALTIIKDNIVTHCLIIIEKQNYILEGTTETFPSVESLLLFHRLHPIPKTEAPLEERSQSPPRQPQNLTSPVDEIVSANWYLEVDKIFAEKLLKEHGMIPSSCVIRPGTFQYHLGVSIVPTTDVGVQAKVFHTYIDIKAGFLRYSIQGTSNAFHTLDALFQHYKLTPITKEDASYVKMKEELAKFQLINKTKETSESLRISVLLNGLKPDMVNGFPLIDMKNVIMGHLIGRGAFSEVYSCKVNGIRCAAKKLHYTSGQTNHQQQKVNGSFEQELNTLARLKHKNIVTMIGYHQEKPGIVIFLLNFQGNIILFMEEFSSSFKGVISDRYNSKTDLGSAYFSVSEVKVFAIDILEGLEYLHTNKIAHRDLKSENILARIDSQGKVTSLHIADFGVSKVFEEEETLLAQTVEGSIPWMAPEIAKKMYEGDNSTLYDPFKADIWSVGILLYEILTGQRPKTVLKDVVQAKRPKLPKEVEKDFKQFVPIYDLCAKGRKNPQKRPTASELLQKIRHIKD